MTISYKTSLLAVFVLVFIVGAVVILDKGRPVNDLVVTETDTTVPVGGSEGAVGTDSTRPTETTQEPAPSTPVTTTPAKNVFTSADIAKHATPEDCWASVSGGVYDLTTWVDRHPGGSGAIKLLCGTDATAKFTKQHGGSGAAKSALGLLKIGTLAN